MCKILKDNRSSEVKVALRSQRTESQISPVLKKAVLNVNRLTSRLRFLVLQYSEFFFSNIRICSQLPQQPLILVVKVYRTTAAFWKSLRNFQFKCILLAVQESCLILISWNIMDTSIIITKCLNVFKIHQIVSYLIIRVLPIKSIEQFLI